MISSRFVWGTGMILGLLLFFSFYRVTLTPRVAQAMTKTQMQAVATAITNAGYPATLILDADGVTWRVRSRTADFSVNVNVVKSLADAQGVSAFVAEVEYR